MNDKKLQRFTALIVLAFFAAGCSATRPADPGRCALLGAGIGGLAGTATGASIDSDDGDTTDNTLIGAGAGAVLGALVGFTACTLMPERAPAPPPPPPPLARAPVVQKTVVLPGVNFGFNRSDLLAPAKQVLDNEVIPELNADPEISVVIEGHTDSVGTEAYNLSLSEKRAAAVESYLLSHGIAPSRVETRGYGETRPIADNDTESGRAKNRRVEIQELK